MTQQDRQQNKVKLYRTLKVVFYCLGLPLFVVAVFLASVRFIGHDPFTGNSDFATQLGFFKDINILFTSPALYGVWIALGIWIAVAIFHIILSKTVKSRRVRTLSVTAFTLVVLLCTLFGMDAGLSAKVDEIYKNAPSTVVAQDYKTLLSYYRTVSSNRHANNLTENLIKQVDLLKNVYNVEMEGIVKTGVAGAISNKPVTYYNIIDDEGNVGVDISFTTDPETGFAKLDCVSSGSDNVFTGDGAITKEVEGKQVIRLAPNADGNLVINGKKYSHYFAEARNSVTGGTLYTWYTIDMESTTWEKGAHELKNIGSGVYGKALYGNNGLLSDGWVFSLENVIEILEDYYEAKDAIDNGEDDYYSKYYAQMYREAVERRDDYYNGRTPDENGEFCSPWLSALYNQEADMNARFSLTRGELDELIAKVGALLGDNSLFDYLFSGQDNLLGDPTLNGVVEGFLGGSLNKFFDQLKTGLALSTFGLNADTLKTVSDILQLLTNKTYDFIDDLYLVLAYKGATDCFDVTHDNLYLALVRGVGSWSFEDGSAVPVHRDAEGNWLYNEDNSAFVTTVNGSNTVDKDGNVVKYAVSVGTEMSDIILDIDFDDRIIESDGENTKYAFDFDTLSAFLNDGINNALDKYIGGLDNSTVTTILNLVKQLNFLKTIDVDGVEYTGLVISGIEIPLINNSENKIDLDINGILTNLLNTMYSYQSAVIKPVWEFYEDPVFKQSDQFDDDPYAIAQRNYAKYERALYEATVFGKMIGSALIGDSLGAGTYPSSLGLNDLASVQKLKTELSYQPTMFPLFAVRDMIAFFAGLIILFYFISFVAAQREDDYACGKLTARSKKEKKAHEAEIIAEFDSLDVENGVTDKPNLDGADVNGADTDEDIDVLDETPKKKAFGRKSKASDDLDLENISDEDIDALSVEEEEKPKKKRFGKKKSNDDDSYVDDLSLDDISGEDYADMDDLSEEKPKKKLFGKKKKEEAEPTADDLADDNALDMGDEEFSEEKPKKKRFGKKKSKDDDSDIDDISLDDISGEGYADMDDFVEEKPKKKLFGKKKKASDGSLEDDGEFLSSENSDGEVL